MEHENIKFNPTLLRRELDKASCRGYFESKHSHIMKFYWKFLKDAGPNCNIVQAALVALWREEMNSAPESFQESLRTGKWPEVSET